MSVISSATGNVTLSDNVSGSTTFSKVLNSVVTGDLSSFAQSLPVGTSATTLSIPNSLAQFVYIKNLSSISGTTVSITWTPTGGTSQDIITLDPGGVMIFAEGGFNGITAMSLSASAASTPVEFLLVG